jgi:signal peptidase II
MRNASSPLALGSLMALGSLALDQATKSLALANAAFLGTGVNVFPGLNLVLVSNSGISFGMLGTVPWWALTSLGLAICGVLAVLLWRTDDRLEATGYGLIIGGALGNVIDRLRLGAVTDFLDFYYGDWHWPAFNLADTAVFSGAAAMILSSVAQSRAQTTRS